MARKTPKAPRAPQKVAREVDVLLMSRAGRGSKPLVTEIAASNADVVRALHGAGHRIELVSKGPVRWTYHTSASQGEALAALAAAGKYGSVSPIPGGAAGYR